MTQLAFPLAALVAVWALWSTIRAHGASIRRALRGARVSEPD